MGPEDKNLPGPQKGLGPRAENHSELSNFNKRISLQINLLSFSVHLGQKWHTTTPEFISSPAYIENFLMQTPQKNA